MKKSKKVREAAAGGNQKALLDKDKPDKKEELSYEWRRIDYFFECFDEESSEEELWGMLKLALGSDDECTTASDRINMIDFYEYCSELIENIYILLQQKKKANSKLKH